MKKITSVLFAATMAFTMVTFTQCKKDKEEPAPAAADYSIDPANANELSKVLQIGNAQVVTGTLPTGTSRKTQSIVYTPSLSVSTGGATTYLPIMYKGTEAVDKIYIMVKGATNQYFSVNTGSSALENTVNIAMTIPKSVNNGQFNFVILLIGNDGAIIGYSDLIVKVTIKKPYECATSSTFISGNDGITQTMHQLNGKAGNVTIEYDTYSVPDRVDVYVDGKWVAGTGSSIAPPPPMCNCSSPLPGFVGDSGTFTIPVTADNKKIEVYVSGCIGGGTAWDYYYKCVQ